ncbi:aspartate kinase [Pseudobacter ginsenosidimutans]|uniref:Aspartokinase n=1 Tax=Pseudobacter ginsenosidimutans TaxID=661488 RepID=A0A4Q7N5V0_9BACT|nr:aspartate kinase [Pseudobacter ginsenosidimutans]QEC44948.1 aspartate kinase [Pseudobacter ginsenosidimutans]RZS76441.1 aspartate kinase [Pseudobacter ginsenosidimutans]
MKVFKFGGASVQQTEKIQNVANIIRSYSDQPILIVVSAMGKTTNALEKVAEAFFEGRQDEALKLFELIKQTHINTAKYLLVTHFNALMDELANFFTEVEWLLHDKPVREYDYYYDQIVCVGELLSTAIVSAYLNESGIPTQWVDVRDIFRTDDNFRDAAIDWNFTSQRVQEDIILLFQETNIVLTQGFIGSTDENESTTLGREGSDYSAAVFANLLNAESQTIWKDVEGVMNADPKQFPDAQFIAELNYEEVIEMAYYGAQVIHPKTIKPLQNKGIPLFVKCFLDKNLPGTVIHNKKVHGLPPIIVIKKEQALLTLHSRDFSFVGEKPVADLYQLLSDIKIKPNIIQTGAVSIQVCLDDKPEKIQKLALDASEFFEVQVEKGLTLLTVRHYQEEQLQKLTNGHRIKLKQQSPETVQVLMQPA